MNTKIAILFASVCTLLYSNTANAQQKIDPTVEVKKDFEGKMLEIHKGKLDTFIDDSLTMFNLNFNYSIFDKPYRDMYEFNPLPSAKIHSPVTQRYPDFFAKVSLGYPLNPKADIYYQPKLYKKGTTQEVTKNTLLFKGYYDAFFGKLPLMASDNNNLLKNITHNEAAANNYVIGALADYRHLWEGGELSTGIEYSSNYYTYYGFDEKRSQYYIKDFGSSKYMRDNFSHTFNQIGVNFDIKSVDAKGKGAKFNYKFYASFKNTSDNIKMLYNPISFFKFKLNENLITAGGEFGPTFGKYNKFLIAVNTKTALYNGDEAYFGKFHNGIIEIIPQYQFERKRLLLNIGVKLSGMFSNYNEADKYHTIFTPHVTVSYELIKRYLWLYGTADGGNNLNNYSSLLQKNKWIMISDKNNLNASSIPLQIKGGFKGKLYDKLSYDVHASYTMHKGLVQFIYSQSGNSFSTIYADHNEFSVGGELNWKTKEFIAGAKIKYSSYTNGKNISQEVKIAKPIGYAPLEGSVFAEYNWRERIYLGANVSFRTATPMYNYGNLDNDLKVNGFADLEITAKYVFNNNFSFFVQGGNLLNSNIQYYAYYKEMGINFNAGIAVKF